MKHVVVVGGSGGIGASLVKAIAEREPETQVTYTWHHHSPTREAFGDLCGDLNGHRLDVRDEGSVAQFAEQVDDIDWVINAVGLLHTSENGPEKSLRHLDPEFFMENMRINALPSLLLAKHLQKKMTRSRPAVFATVSAKVGSIEDNRLGGWTSYRCSKSALNMALKNISLEWRLRLSNVCVAALHPGTTDTPLSLPFQRNVPEHKLFSPAKTAAYLLAVIDALSPEQSGKFWSWDGSELPW